MTTITKTESPSPGDWTFEEWKRRYESALDIPSARGIMHACPDISAHLRMKWPNEDERLPYLLNIIDSDCSGPHPESWKIHLRAAAVNVIVKLIPWRYVSSRGSIEYLTRIQIDALLNFSRPTDKMEGLVNQLVGIEDEMVLRKFISKVCWAVWRGELRNATPAHRLQVLDIFYVSRRLIEIMPSYVNDSWMLPTHNRGWSWEELLPHLEKLAAIDQARHELDSVEEAVFFASHAAYLVVLARTAISAGTAFYDRNA